MFKTWFKKFFLGLFLFWGTYQISAEQQPEITAATQAAPTIDTKVLQTQVLTILNSFIMLLDKIQRAVLTLENLSAEQRADLQKEFEEWGEKLKLQKAQNSLTADQTNLIKILLSADIKIKAAERYLQNKFTQDPFTTKEFENDVEALRKPQFLQNLSIADIEQRLTRSQNRLKGFDKLIADLHKSRFNKAYSWISNKWNTPLFTFPHWGGGGENTGELGNNSRDFYASSLLKRLIIYPMATALTIFNLPEEVVRTIPNQWIRDAILRSQDFLGRVLQPGKQSKKEQYSPATYVPSDEHLYHGGISAREENGRTLFEAASIPMNQQGLPEIKDSNGNIIPVTAAAGRYMIDQQNIKNPDTILQITLDQSGTVEQFTAGQANNYLNQFIRYNGNGLMLANGTTVVEYSPGHFRNLRTGHEVLVSGEQLANALPYEIGIKLDNLYKVDTQGGTHGLFSHQIINPELQSVFVTTTFEKSSELGYKNGIIHTITDAVSWLVDIDRGLPKIQIPVAGYLAKQIVQDFVAVKKEIPNIASYLHKKLRGDKVETKGFGPFVPKETFDDIVGREDLKNQLSPVINYMINPASFIQAGRDVPHGFLLAGEPQTGKTLMVKALAGELSRTLKSIHGDDIKDVKLLQVDVTMLLKYGIAQYMHAVRHYYAPCILFCDEFDLIGAQRSENKEFLSEVLTTLNGFQTSSNPEDLVVFIIATNRPENIDYAIRHYGRCGNTLYFEKPHFEDRKQFFEKFFKKRSINAQRFDIDILAHETEYCSYGELKAITEAIMNVADLHKEPPHQDHALEAIDDVVRKIVTGPVQLSDDQREAFATRYAAKAFATVALNGSKKLAAATIMKITKEIKEKHVLAHYQMVNEKDKKGTEIGGLFTYNLYDSHGFISREDLIKDCKVALAGTIGQEILGLDYISFTDDLKEALRVANLIIFEGLDERDFCPAERAQKRMQVMQLVHQCRQEMVELLTANKDNFARLAQLLQRRTIIRESDVKQLFGLPTIDLAPYLFNMPQNPVTASQFPVIGAQSSVTSGSDELTSQEDEEADVAQQEAQKAQDEAILAYYNQQKQAQKTQIEQEKKKQEEQENSKE